MICSIRNSLFFIIIFIIFLVYPDNRICLAQENQNNIGTATLKAVRENRFEGWIVQSNIFVDGHQIGMLTAGDTKEFSIPADGEKQIFAIKEPYYGKVMDERKIRVLPNDIIILEFNFYSITKIDVKHGSDENNKTLTNDNQNQIKIIELKLNNTLKQKIIKESPNYNIPQGQEKLVEDTLKIVHTVTTEEKSSSSNTFKLKILLIETDIRKEIQKTISKSDAEWSEIKRSVKIIGDGKPIKVIWSELYRTGIAKVEVDGKITDIPFEYKEDFDLTLESVTE